MLQPQLQRTWAPRGQTPQQTVSAKHNRRVSAAGALGWSPVTGQTTFHFQLTFASFNTKQVRFFLRHLRRELSGPIIIVWDNLNAHKSAATYFRKHHPDWFEFEFLPGYSPELNPVDTCWAHTKSHEMPNYTPATAEELRRTVRRHLGRKRRRPDLLTSFIAHSGLAL